MAILKRKLESVRSFTVEEVIDALEEFCGVRYDQKDITSKYGVFVQDPEHPKFGVIVKIYISHIYYTYYNGIENIKSLIQSVAESMNDYYDSDYRKEKDARRILLQKILSIHGRTGNIEVHNMPTNKEVFFSDLRRVMDIVREEIETVVDFNIDFVLDFWNELHEVNY